MVTTKKSVPTAPNPIAGEPVAGEPVAGEPVVAATLAPKEEKPKLERPEATTKTEKKKSILRNVLGKEVPEDDYFYKGIIPPGFENTCGAPVDREELVEVFHKVFKPEDNILFYKQSDKEVYIVIIPVRYATEVGDFNDSIEGDFQKHAISFLTEGSVNIDTMRKKLERIVKFVNYSDR